MEPYRKSTQSTIADVLAYYGKDVSYFRGGFFRSPFREEVAPSFHVSNDCRVWYDHGTSEGGGVIDLVMRLEGTDDREVARKVLMEIEGVERATEISEINKMIHKDDGGHLNILNSGEFISPNLVSYAISRGISYEILSRYCEEVTVSLVGKPELSFNYIGFRNSNDGYVLRNASRNHGKKCTGSFPTFISADGQFTTEPTSDTVLVFEGFFDFLSYISSGRANGVIDSDTLAPGYDICVLNSVSNRDIAKEFILSHDTVNLYLDNDHAGKDAVRFFRDKASDVKHAVVINDKSSCYEGSNDINEYLMAHGPIPM